MRAYASSLVLLLTVGLATVQAQDLQVELPDRVPAPVMSYRGADWLERPERPDEELPDEMLGALGLEPGDVVADIGAGSGFHTRRMARLVAPGGTVYAVDIQPEMIEILEGNVAAEGLSGVVPVLSGADDPGLPEGAVDWILLVDVYHEFSDHRAMLARMRESLSDEGRVALVEYRVEDGTGDHILAAHRMSVRQVLSEWRPAGFDLVELHDFLPSQHLFVFEASGGNGPGIEDYDLVDAIAAGHVRVTTTGLGSSGVGLTIERTRPEPMVITLPVGTYFDALGEASDMVARRDGAKALFEDGPQDWVVLARRVNRSLPVPTPAVAYEVRPAEEHLVERNVMWLFQGLDVHPAILPVVEQLSLWIAAEDAGYDELLEHASSTPISPEDAVGLAVAYLERTGVDITQRRIWTEQERYVPALRDESLRAFFERQNRE